MTSSKTLGGLEEIAGNYDLFLVDQFGVLHDGHTPYAGAIRVLEELKSCGKQIVLLSNSGKRSAPNAERLSRLGFTEDLYHLLVTSGEVAWHQLSSNTATLEKRRCLLLSRGGDRSAVEGLNLQLVEDGTEADIVLISGSEGSQIGLEVYAERLRPAAQRGVACLCTNPDKLMITPAGLDFGAGRIAELYESLGGSVQWIGKPWSAIYRFAMERSGNPAPERVIGIGDSVEHDIAGAGGIGAASVLIKAGILADTNNRDLSELFEKHGATPDFLLQSFVWN
ncbi:TIGR01459 family HAD-type hydrolase [Pelagibius sp. Alg239-R121]|uniref:TIGR01459 family HAD-type hydrolase n=1 Tax=Pelagibius sp. Alg239-R121 TaxID=2993448 RepID=UPI0024A67073|nr:TIGR01459 family HAD-type hydrolase [Pelagibius sp. Alg239-R121]